jgi:serine/threonine protein kinase
MQSAIFVKPRLEKTFPNWTRRDLVNVAGAFIDHVSYLHSLNIIVGDINPMNVLVNEDSTKVWIVDTDSFQIEGFPCPVGTVNFTPAEIQGKNYSTFLRTKDHELFAVATMIFMILFPGKPPYSQQGGGSPSENIKSRNFPYRFFKDGAADNLEVTGEDAPQGTWQFIWANIPNSLRAAFFKTFREDKRVGIDEWVDLLLKYVYQLDKGYSTNDLFPLGFKIRDPVQTTCSKCTSVFTASQKQVDKIATEGKPLWCPDCANRMRLERLAAQSKRTTEQTTAQRSAQSSSKTHSQTKSTTSYSSGSATSTSNKTNTGGAKNSGNQGPNKNVASNIISTAKLVGNIALWTWSIFRNK